MAPKKSASPSEDEEAKLRRLLGAATTPYEQARAQTALDNHLHMVRIGLVKAAAAMHAPGRTRAQVVEAEAAATADIAGWPSDLPKTAGRAGAGAPPIWHWQVGKPHEPRLHRFGLTDETHYLQLCRLLRTKLRPASTADVPPRLTHLYTYPQFQSAYCGPRRLLDRALATMRTRPELVEWERQARVFRRVPARQKQDDEEEEEGDDTEALDTDCVASLAVLYLKLPELVRDAAELSVELTRATNPMTAIVWRRLRMVGPVLQHSDLYEPAVMRYEQGDDGLGRLNAVRDCYGALRASTRGAAGSPQERTLLQPLTPLQLKRLYAASTVADEY
jgi:hypothetical protein